MSAHCVYVSQRCIQSLNKLNCLFTPHKTFFTQTLHIIHQNCLCLFLHNHLCFSRNKSSMHGVRHENILALHPLFSCYWCPYISCSHLLCIHVCWAAVNHLCIGPMLSNSPPAPAWCPVVFTGSGCFTAVVMSQANSSQLIGPLAPGLTELIS